MPAHAYYWQAIAHLREALRDPAIDLDSAQFHYAAVCLRAAFTTTRGDHPSCDRSTHGMWTGDYAPFIALAIIEAERTSTPPVRPR